METPSLGNLKNLLIYPFKDQKSGTKILIGSLLIFGSLIIPILPILFVLGYIIRISKRIIDGDGQLGLPNWDDWGNYISDGFKWFAVVFIYSIPVMIVFTTGYSIYMFSFIGLAFIEDNSSAIIFSIIIPFFGMGVLFISIFIGIFLAIIESLFLPTSLMHVVHTGKFSAAFKIGQWWPILKKNFLGFIVAIIFMFGFYYFLMMAFSALYMSIIFCFLLPLAMAPLSFLMGLWSIPLFAQAYRETMPGPEEIETSEE
ncbi:MAG TPA: DUF4013 domain-containing protein [Anaerolineaceae bacterium]|nr:DUF4013 domain-containing protein [Anaerolineaceae bacterium]